MVATVTSKGQITIPIEVRRKLELHEGDRVTFVFAEGHCEVVPMHNSIRDLKGILPRPRKHLSLKDIELAIASGAGG